MYQTTPDDSLAIGIPDVAILGQSSPDHSPSRSTAVAEPMTIELPMLEEVQERYLEVREVGSGQVVTVIEVLSPKNKRTGEGRQAYLSKRQRILASQTHLIEIDLLRGGESLPMVGAGASQLRLGAKRISLPNHRQSQPIPT